MEEESTYVEGEPEVRAWDDLPLDVLGHIFEKIGLPRVVQVISLVCKSWKRYLDEPQCWQKISVDEWSCEYEDGYEGYNYKMQMLIERSFGCLRELSVSYAGDKQILFIAEHVDASLQTLRLPYAYIGDSTAEQVSRRLSGLTTLDLASCREISPQGLESIGRNCQKLVSLTIGDAYGDLDQQDVVRAIAHTFPKIRQLCVADIHCTTSVALEILSSCPDLETLDFGRCDISDDLDLDLSLLKEKHPNVTLLLELYEDDYDYDGMDDYPLGEDVWF